MSDQLTTKIERTTNPRKVTVQDKMDTRDCARLLDYYRMRVENFEKERIEWLEKLEGLRISQEEYHKMQWESRRRTDEINELQNALSETNIALNQERKHNINLTGDLETLKLRMSEDRKRLMQMLNLAEPIEQTIKLYFDRRPELREKFANSESDIVDSDNISLNANSKSIISHSKTQSNLLNFSGKNTSSSLKVKSSSRPKTSISGSIKNYDNRKIICKTTNTFAPRLEYRIPPSDEKQQIIRTVLLPDQNPINSANEENEFLRRQLVELKNFYENQILKLEEDRRLREEEYRLGISNSKEKLDDMIRKNQKLEKLNYELTKDFMQLKFDSSNSEKDLFEEIETLKLQNEALSVSLKEVIYRTDIDKESAKSEYERKTKEVSSVMRSQVKTHEENSNIIKEQYKQIQKIYTTRVKELEMKLKNLTERQKNMENKRNYDLEGYINEIALVRKRMRSFEDYIHKLRRMTHGTSDRTGEIGNNLDENQDNFSGELKDFRNDMDKLDERLKQDYYDSDFKMSNSGGMKSYDSKIQVEDL